MDGTLLRKDHTISAPTQQLLQALIQKGIWVVPVSARPLHGMMPIIGPVLDERMPVASLNGSYIVQQGEVIRQISVGLSYSQAIYEHIKDQETTPLFYSQMEWFSTKDSDMVKKEQRITKVPVAIQPFEKTLQHWQQQNSGPNKILITGNKELVKETELQLAEKYRGHLNVYPSQPGYLEIMDLQASKKSAVEFLIDRFGISREETIAMGDNYNDKDMIEFAGMGVAMGNAPDEIKAIANYVTDTNNEDGVAKALANLLG